MAELDLLSRHGYAEEQRGPLTVRTAAVVPPAHPLGPEYAEPHWSIWASDSRVDAWICLWNSTDPDGDMEKLDDDDLVRAAKLSILVGVPWDDVFDSADSVRRVQEAALTRLPMEVYEQTLDQLLLLRSAINAVNPFVVATLIGMTYHWQTDPGGTRGPRTP
jgi:hypothetical protein